MKKQLFALALTTLLVGCVRNQQVQVTDVEFYYATQSKNSVIKITRATVSQTIVSKTKDFEKINKELVDATGQKRTKLIKDTSKIVLQFVWRKLGLKMPEYTRRVLDDDFNLLEFKNENK